MISLAGAIAGTAVGQVRVSAQADTSKPIYLGEQFAYHVVILGDNRSGQVDITPLAKFNPQKAGERDMSQRSTTIINGRRTEEVSKRYAISYALTAGAVGVMKIPPVSVTVGGKVYKTNAVSVEVVKPGDTEKMDIEVELSTEQCYVGQPLIMTVKWFVWATEAGAVGDFQFNVPLMSEGLFFVEDVDETQQNQNRNMRKVNGEPVTLYQRQVKHDGVDSVEVFFTKVIIPKQAGKIEIKPATISVDMAVGGSRQRRNDFFSDFFASQREYKRFVANSNSLTLNVLSLPSEGKPKDFYGLVGQYNISTTASPTEVNVGDPITLKIRVGGSKYLKPVEMPDLEFISAIADNFKIATEDVSSVVENGFKVFTQTIRAKNDTVTEIPAIGLSYFDAKKGKFATVSSKPLKLEVAPTRVVTQADIEGGEFTVFGKSVEIAKMGISANYEGTDAFDNQHFSPIGALISPGYAVVWGLPFAIVVLSGFAKIVTHSTPEKAAAARRRGAFSNAVKAAKKTARHSDSKACELLAMAMKQYAADKFGKVAGSLTAEDCFGLITGAGCDSEAASRYRDVIESCQAGIYSGANVKYEPALVREVVVLMRRIDKEVKR